MGLNGSRIHRAFVALNLNMSLPLLITTKVCKNFKAFGLIVVCNCLVLYPLIAVKGIDVFKWCASKFWWEVILHPYR